MEEGNLREYLKNKYSKVSLEDKLERLEAIASALIYIHDRNLVHRDLHSGNILNGANTYGNFISHISDLGLSCPANYQKQDGQIFGVLPYVAPEVLRGQPYTQKSDIYSFGIIAYELLANAYPEMNEIDLTLAICNGLRPNIDKVPIPQLLKDFIKNCWDTNPNNRPSDEELGAITHNLNIKITSSHWKEKKQFHLQYQAIKEEYNTFSQNTPYQIHPTATLTSKMIDTNEITKKLKTMEVSSSLEPIDFTQLNLKDKEDTNNENNQVWTNIHSNFIKELISQWKENNFNCQQTQDWINIGLQSTDYNFCAWLRDKKHLTPEQILNKSNLEQLNQEFFTYWQECNAVALQSKDREQQQTNIEILPKK